MDLSVVIPLYNEEENIRILYKQIVEALQGYSNYEIIVINDGSTDKTLEICKNIHASDQRFKIISFRRNYGQSAALAAGFEYAKGMRIVSLDGDLQNDPADIPRLLEKLDQGFDAVVGWRFERKDKLSKRAFSVFGRILRRLFLKDKTHDSGCTLKAYKKTAVDKLELMGEMHRYINEILTYNGFKVAEIKVNHRERSFGKTKYNLRKLPRGFLDMLIIYYQQKYSTRPIHLFGGLGLLSILAGFFISVYLLIVKYGFGQDIGNRPLLLLAILLIIIGIQFIVLGIITDILVRIYYREGKRDYNIEEILD